MRILISNDDGVYSPGLAALARAATEFGEVHVVAPDVERSSASHSISSHPLSYRPTDIPGVTAHRVNGTPADCVALGVHLGARVDVVLSGLNLGLNLGHGIWHSGTIAAAKQATMLGIRGIALSVPAGEQPVDFEALRPWFRKVLQSLLREVTTPRLVNVNFPREPRGIVWTRAAVQHYDGRIFPAKDPLGRDVYWFSVAPVDAADQATDRWAVEQGWVSMTPLEVDPTDEELLHQIAAAHPMDDARARVVSPRVSTSEAAAKVRVDEAGI
jgi:5'-nucleotidase